VTQPESVLIVIFDTNALLPLLLGATHRAKNLRRAWQARRFELFITPQILTEAERVLTYPRVRRNFGLTRTEIETVLTVLQTNARLLPGLYEGITTVQTDITDNIFLTAALEIGADYLVSQDAHLLNLKYYQGTQIISLAQFSQLLEIEGGERPVT
jgi:putative PIN family toxin of toxin-antitoxin system